MFVEIIVNQINIKQHANTLKNHTAITDSINANHFD